MYCKRCGEKIVNMGEEFCLYCGIKLNDDSRIDMPVDKATVRRKCPYCGNPVPTIASMCTWRRILVDFRS